MSIPSKLTCNLKIEPIQFELNTSGFFGSIFGFFKWRTTPRLWLVTEDAIIWCEYLNCWIKIPQGFVFDGASIPKLLQFIINPTDAVLYGALVHDFVYRFNQLIVCYDTSFGNWEIREGITRSVADELLKNISKQYDKVPGAALIVYIAIVPSGIFAWLRARKRNYKLTDPYPDPYNSYLNKGIKIHL